MEEQVEVAELRSESTAIEFEANRLKSSSVQETSGTAVRVVRHGKLVTPPLAVAQFRNNEAGTSYGPLMAAAILALSDQGLAVRLAAWRGLSLRGRWSGDAAKQHRLRRMLADDSGYAGTARPVRTIFCAVHFQSRGPE